jgi:hypothetical protein
MKKSVRVTVGLIVSFVCLFMWGAAAMNYDDSVAVGKYRFTGNGEFSTLVLKPDHSFQQDLQMGNIKRHGEGTWRRVGEGGISFSKEFLVVSGDEPEPDGTTFCDMHKTMGLFVSLRLRQYHVLWYGKAGSDTSVQGTYTGDEPGVSATLALNADHSFDQTLTHDGVSNHASGTWNQLTNGTIEFSKAFLKTSGEPLRPDESASSMDPRGSNLQVEISTCRHAVEPVFYKLSTFR